MVAAKHGYSLQWCYCGNAKQALCTARWSSIHSMAALDIRAHLLAIVSGITLSLFQ